MLERDIVAVEDEERVEAIDQGLFECFHQRLHVFLLHFGLVRIFGLASRVLQCDGKRAVL